MNKAGKLLFKGYPVRFIWANNGLLTRGGKILKTKEAASEPRNQKRQKLKEAPQGKLNISVFTFFRNLKNEFDSLLNELLIRFTGSQNNTCLLHL